MKVPQNAIIPQANLTQYLLIFKPRNDKSKFLAQAGFTLENWPALEVAIQDLIMTAEAFKDEEDEYGTFYRVEGEIIGTNNRKLSIITIWLQRKIDNQFQFITLKPRKELRSEP